MTVAIALRVHDGVVLASDSVSTISNGPQVLNTYSNANKIFNLRKGLPVGAITWGVGSLGGASIETLAKDFRQRLTLGTPDHACVRPGDTYTIGDIAERLARFIYDEHYEPAFRTVQQDQRPALGFFVAGYSHGGTTAEVFHLEFGPHGTITNPVPAPMGVSLTWAGSGGAALSRLVNGFAPELPALVGRLLNLQPQQVGQLQASLVGLGAPMVLAAMPLQDTIDLAEWLVGVSSQYSRFCVGPATVGGPAEVAAISKHEDFKWIRRKHYFRAELNPPMSGTERGIT